jgi:hypothetical protein
MNIHDANRISIPEILSKLNLEPKKSQNTKSWYLSPFRSEKTASFQVDLKNNRWYDYGEGFGGDVVDFVCNYLKHYKEAHSKSDALRWIKNMSDDSVNLLNITPIPPNSDKDDLALIFKKSGAIKHLGLINYLNKRGIPLSIAQKHLKEVQVLNKVTNRKIIALGLSNEEGGYELRNPLFKGCIAPKAISFIRGEIPKPQSISIFEGFMDYLSFISQMNGKPLKSDAIILNSLSCLSQINAYIRGYGYDHVYTWMDNDQAGQNATIMLDNFFKTQEGIIHKPMNKVYAPYKDVNEWHMSKQ